MRTSLRPLLLTFALAAVAFGCAPQSGDGPGDGPEAEFAAGRALYERHGCALCHGPDGRGDGPIAATLDPPPRDLGDPSAYRVGPSLAEIASTIEQGILVFGGSGMAPYAHIPEADRQEIARYIVSLQPAPPPPPPPSPAPPSPAPPSAP